MHGSFIVLEGPDGAGTTTQSRFLAERLRAEGRDVVLTAEPTDGKIGRWIRTQLHGQEPPPALALQLLFCADRAEHVEATILPALAAGKTVICDRYWHSTVVYAEAQGLDARALADLNRQFVQPDHVVFTLPSIEVCLERMNRRAEKDVFEEEAFQRKIHAGYVRLAEADPSIRVVDTSGEKAVVSAEIARLIV